MVGLGVTSGARMWRVVGTVQETCYEGEGTTDGEGSKWLDAGTVETGKGRRRKWIASQGLYHGCGELVR